MCNHCKRDDQLIDPEIVAGAFKCKWFRVLFTILAIVSGIAIGAMTIGCFISLWRTS